MGKDENLISRFKQAFEKDYGLSLTDKEVKEATGNLVNFFDFLWKFDQEDKQREIKMKGLKNESRNL